MSPIEAGTSLFHETVSELMQIALHCPNPSGNFALRSGRVVGQFAVVSARPLR
jgi:hypothetical protein